MTIKVRAHDGEQDIYLNTVDQHTTAQDAAHELWNSVHNAAKIHGGAAKLRSPDEGQFSWIVVWESGPKQWADAYVVSEGASAPGFTVDALVGTMVRFTDSH